jgi:5-methylcytosine-specific restriction endonuclease McrA
MATTKESARRPTIASSAAAPLRRRCRGALDSHRKRAKADGLSITYGLRDLEALALASPCCEYCGCVLLPSTLVFDHRTPTARVATSASYSLRNLAVCCIPCNSAKGQLSTEEFQKLRDLVNSWHPRAGCDLLARLRSGGQRYARSRKR